VKVGTEKRPKAGFARSTAETVLLRKLPCDASISDRTEALAIGLDLVMAHHGAPQQIRVELKAQLATILSVITEEILWMKYVKYILAYPLAQYLRNEPPPSVDGLPLSPFRGNLLRWLTKRLRAFNRTNTHLWYSWYQAKRATIACSDEFVETVYNEHLATLTSPDPGLEEIIDQIFGDATFLSVLDCVKKGTAKRYKKGFAHLPSTNSSFEAVRSAGGQYGALMKECGLHPKDLYYEVKDQPSLSWPPGEELSKMEFRPYCFSRRGILTNPLVEFRQAYGSEFWSLRNIDLDKAYDALNTDYWFAYRDPLKPDYNSGLRQKFNTDEPLSCTIQAVLEPMKVRVISKGNALPYYTMKPLQIALHSTMRRMACFRLIGRPFSPTDIMDLARKAKPSDQWFSIDYKASTDYLSWRYSKKILEYVTSDLDEETRAQALSVLGPHRLHYPVDGGPCIEYRGTQTNGQLMGSILSFPILCLANLGVYLLNTQRVQESWKPYQRLSHVLVNGDDMLYASDPALWQSHITLGKGVGLVMSVGKAYLHPTYFNINSISGHYNLAAKKKFNHKVTPWQIDFLNVGLFMGQHKIQGKMENDDRDMESPIAIYASSHHMDESGNIATNINKLLEGSLPGKGRLLLDWFLRDSDNIQRIRGETLVIDNFAPTDRYVFNKYGVKKLISFRNLFLPLSVGGCGVVPPRGFQFRVTTVDKLRAFNLLIELYRTGSNFQIGGYPLNGHEVVQVEKFVEKPWYRVPGSDYKPAKTLSSWEVLKPLRFSRYDAISGFTKVNGVRSSQYYHRLFHDGLKVLVEHWHV